MIRNLLPLFLFATMSVFSNAQPGMIDTTFGNPADTLGDSTRFDYGVAQILQQPDGKLLLAGSMQHYNGETCKQIIRLNEDGSFDNSFDCFPYPVLNGSSGVTNIALQPDGKIIFAGSFNSAPNQNVMAVGRLNTDGSFDSTFFIGTGFNQPPWGMALQSDGKIMVSGAFTIFNDDSVKYLIRLNSDGSVDPTFQTGSSFDYGVSEVAVQADGKIIAAGNFYSYQGTPSPFIIRLQSDGAKDTTFIPGYWDSYVAAILIQPDQKILVGGGFANPEYRFVRLNSDGSQDTSFHVKYRGANQSVNCFSLQPDGKILMGGTFTMIDSIPTNGIIRLNPDGSRDSTYFVGHGILSPATICVQSNGKLMVGGGFSEVNGTFRNHIARLTPDGYLEEIYRVKYGFDNIVKKIKFQQDGKLLASGYFNRYNGSNYNNLIRLHSSDGSIDTSFHTDLTNFNYINDLEIDNNLNKIYVVGRIDLNFNSVHRYGIARLDQGGFPDTTFFAGPGFNFSCTINAVKIQPDGKILAGGDFTSYNGTSVHGVVRILPDGNRDSTFSPTALFPNGHVNDMILQSDGKLLICGDFYYYLTPGILTHNIARLMPDGSIDSTFNPGLGFLFDSYTLALQPDGKVLVGGDLRRFNISDTCYGLARLNSDGSLDSSFYTGTKVNGGDVLSILVQPDGKIIIGGEFINYDSHPQSKIVRLNTDASLDNTFTIGTGFDYEVYSMAFDQQGRLLAGGRFLNYDDYSIKGLCRLNPGIITSVKELIASKAFTIYPNPSRGRINFGNDSDFNFPLKITISNLLGEVVEFNKIYALEESINISQPDGIYIVTLNDGTNIMSRKVLLQK